MNWDTPGIHWDAGLRWDQPLFPISLEDKKMIFKLLTGFDRLNLAAFLGKVQQIKVALTTEPALTLLPDPWPASYPSRANITAAYTAFENAFDAAREGGKTLVDTRDMKRAALEKMLQDVAPYFESVAKAANNITILDATGYGRRQPPVPAPDPLPAPVLKLSRNGMSGVLLASAPRIKGGTSYEVQTCTGDPSVESNWKHTLTSTGCRGIELTGLTPGQLYYGRMRAVGGRGPGLWSGVASLMAV